MRFLGKIVLLYWLILLAIALPQWFLRRAPIPPHYWITESKVINGNRDLYIRLNDIGITKRITIDPAPDYMPIWSPDGQWIVFETDREIGDGLVNPSLYLIRPDGRQSRHLINLPFSPTTHLIEWSPDSQTLAIEFQSNNRSLLRLISIPEGRLIQEFVTEPISTESTWSSNGKWLLSRQFQGFIADGSEQSLLYRIDVQTGQRLLLSTLPAAHNFRWSPNDEWVIFVAPQNGNQEIFRVHNDGTNLQNLTNHPMNDTRPAWSPDGEWIAFTRNAIGADQINVFQMRPDGTDLRAMTDQLGLNLYPQWSPNGEKILFTSVETRRGVAGWTLSAINQQTQNINVLAKNIESSPPPQWSPNGEWLVTIGGLVLRNDVYVLNPDQNIYQRLTYSLYRHENPVWSPDGQWIIYRARDEIRQVHIDQNDLSAVQVLSDFHPARDARTYAHYWSPTLDHYEMFSGWSPDMPQCKFGCTIIFWGFLTVPIMVAIPRIMYYLVKVA